jgi:hypothetical protein
MAHAKHVTSAIGVLMIGASAKTSTSPVRAAHVEFATFAVSVVVCGTGRLHRSRSLQ